MLALLVRLTLAMHTTMNSADQPADAKALCSAAAAAIDAEDADAKVGEHIAKLPRFAALADEIGAAVFAGKTYSEVHTEKAVKTHAPWLAQIDAACSGRSLSAEELRAAVAAIIAGR